MTSLTDDVKLELDTSRSFSMGRAREAEAAARNKAQIEIRPSHQCNRGRHQLDV
ncbi:MAG: hypothetical protein V8T46_11510 [Sutterella seckii]